jgi:hypothetical protein
VASISRRRRTPGPGDSGDVRSGCVNGVGRNDNDVVSSGGGRRLAASRPAYATSDCESAYALGGLSYCAGPSVASRAGGGEFGRDAKPIWRTVDLATSTPR